MKKHCGILRGLKSHPASQKYYLASEVDVLLIRMRDTETQRAKEAIKYRKRIKQAEDKADVLRKIVEDNKEQIKQAENLLEEVSGIDVVYIDGEYVEGCEEDEES